MSISEEHREKFGKECKWLNFGYDCHRTICVMNWARQHVLWERCEDLGMKHPEFSRHVFSDYCVGRHGDYSCFDSGDADEHGELVTIDGIEYTPFEAEALKIAKEELKDDDKVKQLYLHGKELYMTEEEKRIQEKVRALEKLKNEVE